MDMVTLAIGAAGGFVGGVIASSVFGFTWSKMLGIFAKKVPASAPAIAVVEKVVAAPAPAPKV
jgi:hypothetical protein